MVRINKHQKEILNILKNGGKLFHFEDCTFGLDDIDGNILRFNKKTFEKLYKLKYIQIVERPALNIDIWGLSENGLKFLNKKPDVEKLQQKDLSNIKKFGQSNNENYA